MKKTYFLLLLIIGFLQIKADDGYKLWLRYDLISDPQLVASYNRLINGVMFFGNSPTIKADKGRVGTWNERITWKKKFRK
jgi:alpha-glucuronidase